MSSTEQVLLSRISSWLQVEQSWSLWQPSYINSNTLEFQNMRLENLRRRLWYHQQQPRIMYTNKVNNKFYLDIEEELISDNEEDDDDDDDDDDDSVDLIFEKKKDTSYQPISLLTQMIQHSSDHKPLGLKRCQAKLSLDAWFSSITAEK